jgi:hypothetical protein
MPHWVSRSALSPHRAMTDWFEFDRDAARAVPVEFTCKHASEWGCRIPFGAWPVVRARFTNWLNLSDAVSWFRAGRLLCSYRNRMDHGWWCVNGSRGSWVPCFGYTACVFISLSASQFSLGAEKQHRRRRWIDDGLVLLEKAPSGQRQGWRTPSLTSRLSMAPRCRPRVSSPGSQYRCPKFGGHQFVQNSQKS